MNAHITTFVGFTLTAALSHAAPTLRISSHDIRPESKYELVFDQAVVADSQLNKALDNTWLSISPNIPGKIIWSARNKAHFLPDTAPQLNTTYQFAIVKKLKYADGTDIPATDLAKLATTNFQQDYTYRHFKISDRLPISYVRFNDDINPTDNKLQFYYKSKEGLTVPAEVKQAVFGDVKSTYYLEPSWQKRFEIAVSQRNNIPIPETKWEKGDVISNALTVTPQEPLPVGKDWNLHVKAGTHSSNKKYATLAESSQYIWSVEPLELNEVEGVVVADKPREIALRFNSSLENLKPEQLNELISITPLPQNLRFKANGENAVIVHGDFSERTNWNVTIKKQLTAKNGLALSSDVTKEVIFKHLSSGIGLPAFNSSQQARGTRTFNVETVNMRELQISIKKLNREQAIRVAQGYRHYSGDDHGYQSIKHLAPLPFALVSGETIYQKTVPLENAIDTSKAITLDWSEILGNKDSSATLFISITGQPKEGLGKDQQNVRIAQSVIQLTDIGMAWKLSKDKAWVYCYSLQTGEPLAGVDILLAGEDATQLNSAKTDASGLTSIPRSEADRHLIASLGNDQAMVAFDEELDTVSMWRFPVDFAWEEQNFWQRDTMMFTDRNLYRPGETARLKGIVREFLDSGIRIPDLKQATLTVINEGREIQQTSITLSDNGSFDHTYTFPDEIVGRYQFRITIPKPEGEENHELRTDFTHSVSVQEFRRNSFEITSHLPQTKPNDKQIQLDLTADYYQGTPVAKGSVDWYFYADQTGFYPEKFRDYLFCDHRRYDSYYWSYYFGYEDHSENNYTNAKMNGKADLDNEGRISLVMEIPACEFPSPQKLAFRSEITDSRDQTLSHNASVIHHPTDLYFGISRVDQLIRIKNEVPLTLVAVTNKGEYTGAEQTATLTISRETFETVKIQSTSGETKTKNEKRIEAVSTQEVTISGSQPTPLSFIPEKPGHYTLKLTGKDAHGNLTSTASSFYVYGSDVYPWATEDGMRIKLVPEQKNYKPGDTAKILIMTPIEGNALITIERQGVIKSFRRELKADNPVIELPIDESYAPNAYISVLVMRGAAQSPHKHKEPVLKLGYCDIQVDHPAKHLTVALNDSSESTRPGESVTLSGSVTDHLGKPVAGAEVVLFAEDEGTLSVMGYKDPEPFGHFHRSRPLTLYTGVSLSYFLNENPELRYIGNKGFIIGDGDGGDEVNLDMPIRKNFDPCAHWSPNLVTGADGGFQASFKAPDTLTRYRVIAVALKDADRFGTARSSFMVNKDIMLEPKPPRFAHEGDQIQSKVLVQNTSKYDGTWEISLRGDSLSKVSDSADNTAMQKIKLAAGESATVSFQVSFLNTGETTWVWNAKPLEINGQSLNNQLLVKLSDSMENRFQVAYPRPLLRETAYFTHQANSEPVNLVKGFTPVLMGGRGHLDLEFSNSLLLEAGGAADYLLQYPYGCAEQTTSSMMPWFAVRDLKNQIPGFAKKSDTEVATALQKGTDRLLSMQTSSGGLGYWPGDSDPTDWASAYGGMALVMAKEHGANVPKASLDQLASYLSAYVRKVPAEQADSWRDDCQSRALYVLAMLGQPEIPEQNKMIARKDSLSSSSLAFLAMAIHLSGDKSTDPTELLKAKSTHVPTDHWMHYRNDLPVQLLAWSTIAPKDPQVVNIMRQLLASRNRQGHWNTTWVNGWTMYAMATYARNAEADLADATVTLTTSQGSRSLSLTKDKPLINLRLPLEEAQELLASSDARVFIRVVVSSKPEIAPTGPISKEGIAIHRKYERALPSGAFEPLDTPKLGDLVRVSLTVTFPDVLDYVVIDDSLPSVMETVNNEFASQSSHVRGSADRDWNVSRMELRDDRAVFFLNRSWGKGTQTLSYMARITAAGTVHAPPAKVEAMYDPARYGLSDTAVITVQP